MAILNHQNRCSKYMKEKLIRQVEIDKSIIMVGDFGIPPLIFDRTSKQKSVRI